MKDVRARAGSDEAQGFFGDYVVAPPQFEVAWCFGTRSGYRRGAVVLRADGNA